VPFLTGWIPDEKISEIRSASDIVEVISEVVILKRAGRNFIGLCPFHAEKTPSFTVSPEKQIFYCFGCGAGGNIFTFLMKYQGTSFLEATTALAKRYGIPLPERAASSKQQYVRTDRERILEINQMAMEYYHTILLNESNGEVGRVYLRERGITDATLEAFQIGYAPKGWDHFAAHLNRKRIPTDTAFKSGLVIPRKKGGGGYDRFRERILFPIRDLGGQVIGFGGRVLDDSLPKYLNSPETATFQKGRSLYGLDRARKACRESDSVIIVEGYFDVIALHQHGIANTVATLGTGVTPDHIRLLKGFAQTFYFVFDPDVAGIKAVERVIPILIRENVTARIVRLPDGKDPDVFVREKGPKVFSDLVARSLPAMSFLIESAKIRHGPTPSGKSRIVSDLENTLASIDDEINRSIFVKAAAEGIGIEEDLLFQRVLRIRQKSGAKETFGDGFEQGGPADDVFSTDQPVRFEKKILTMMLQYPVMIPEIRTRRIVEQFSDPDLKDIGRLILSYTGAPEALIPEVISMGKDPETGKRIVHLAAGEDSWNAEGCLKLIRQFELHCDRPERADLNARIHAAQKENDHALLADLLKEKQRMIHKRD